MAPADLFPYLSLCFSFSISPKVWYTFLKHKVQFTPAKSRIEIADHSRLQFRNFMIFLLAVAGKTAGQGAPEKGGEFVGGRDRPLKNSVGGKTRSRSRLQELQKPLLTGTHPGPHTRHCH